MHNLKQHALFLAYEKSKLLVQPPPSEGKFDFFRLYCIRGYIVFICPGPGTKPRKSMKLISNEALSTCFSIWVEIHMILLSCVTKYKTTAITALEDASQAVDVFCMLISERVLEQRLWLGSV